MHHCYVYYKISPDLQDETVAKVRRMQRSLADAIGTQGRLVAREGSDGVTLMEIYEHIEQPAMFERALAQSLSRSSLSAELRNARRTERFEDV